MASFWGSCSVSAAKPEAQSLFSTRPCCPQFAFPQFEAMLLANHENRSHSLQGMPSFVNGKVRLLKLENRLVEEDHLDKRWEEATGESVDETIFLNRHGPAFNRPALTVHPIGTPHLHQDEVPMAGGRPGWAAPPNPRIGPWLWLLKSNAESHKLVPEFEVTLEATHHGPEISSPAMFVEIGSTEEYWKRQDAAQAIALLVWEGLGLGGGNSVGDWSRKGDQPKVCLGIGGGHYYVPWHMDIARKDGVWGGHPLSGYSLPMEEPTDSKEVNLKGVAGMWREAIKIAFETTRSAFPGGEVLAHLDLKSFKSWQRNAVTELLASEEIKIGKHGDFC